MNAKTITVLMPSVIPDFAEELSGSKIGTARFVVCEMLERRLIKVGGEARLEYHKTGTTARIFVLSKSASDIEAGAIGIAAMCPEGYWELVSVMC